MDKCWLFDRCNHKDCEAPFCLRKFKLDQLYRLALLSEQQKKHIELKVDADGTDLPEFRRLAQMLKDTPGFVADGKNLFLHSSNCGNGKTTWAVRFLQNYLDTLWHKTDLRCRALFISVPRFLLALKENISEKNDYASFIKENVMDADVVVWDDIAAKVGSEFQLNHLLGLIDGRLALGKANIYTSNLSSKNMEAALGARLASRICNYAIDIELHGADKRKFSEVIN